jgi:hypothetical protein
LRGKDFFPDSMAYFGSSPLATRFISQEELAALIPSYLVQVGTFPIVVINPKPREFPDRGGVSNALPLIVGFAPE